MWLHGQAVKTLASHAGIRGSIPLGVIGQAPEVLYLEDPVLLVETLKPG